MVPVASVNRLRKLRETEEEDYLPGDVYVERLRGARLGLLISRHL